jgi:periplasmic divalent cation tolerance protein
MERAVLVYTTFPSIVEAERTGRALVERRLCACVNILPGMVSHYWWQGAVERGEEVVMIIKTRGSLAEHVGTAVKEMHSYTTPAILVIPIESIDKGYLDWLMAALHLAGERRSSQGCSRLGAGNAGVSLRPQEHTFWLSPRAR